MTNIIKIDHKEYGLTETKAKEVSELFVPMLKKMEALEVEYNQLLDIPMSEEKTKQAKELRLKYVKVRTGTAAIHKELKSFYLQGGRFVDGWKNAQQMASQGIEKKLAEVENHYKIIEQNRIKEIADSRTKILNDLGYQSIPNNIGEMEDDMFNAVVDGVKLQRKQAAEAAEAAKIEAERLKKEAEEKAKADEAERKRILKENEALKKQKQAEEKKRLEAEKEKKKLQDKIDAEMEAKLKAIQEKERLKDLESSKPDKEKLLKLSKQLDAFEFPKMSTKKGIDAMRNIKDLLKKVSEYSVKKSKEL